MRAEGSKSILQICKVSAEGSKSILHICKVRAEGSPRILHVFPKVGLEQKYGFTIVTKV